MGLLTYIHNLDVLAKQTSNAFRKNPKYFDGPFIFVACVTLMHKCNVVMHITVHYLLQFSITLELMLNWFAIFVRAILHSSHHLSKWVFGKKAIWKKIGYIIPYIFHRWNDSFMFHNASHNLFAFKNNCYSSDSFSNFLNYDWLVQTWAFGS